MVTIITSECVKCPHGTLDDSVKSRVKVHCDYKNKDYYYGQYVPCDYSSGRRKKGKDEK